MQRLRTQWGTWIAVGLLLVGTLPMVLGPVVSAQWRPVAHQSFSGWLRAQLPDLPAEAVESALKAAEETDSATLDAFVAAFASAYGVQQASTPHALSRATLLAQLRTHVQYIANRMLSARLLLQAASSTTQAPASDRLLSAAGLSAYPPVLRAYRVLQVVVPSLLRVEPLRVRLTEQPMGP